VIDLSFALHGVTSWFIFLKFAIFLPAAAARKLGRQADARRSRARDRWRLAEFRRRNGNTRHNLP
jgi:hypothetical protein